METSTLGCALRSGATILRNRSGQRSNWSCSGVSVSRAERVEAGQVLGSRSTDILVANHRGPVASQNVTAEERRNTEEREATLR